MTPAEIARLRALCDHVWHGEIDETWTPSRTAQARYMAAAMNALPAALDEIERLRALLAKSHQCPTCEATCRGCQTCGYQF